MNDRGMTNDNLLEGASSLEAVMLSHSRLCNDLW